jgi:hypothetical protein
MALSFPNACRSYDSRALCVRFWAHDRSFEVPFFVEATALCHMDPTTSPDESGLLGCFDRHRDRICAAAGRAYARGRRGSYTLSAADLI